MTGLISAGADLVTILDDIARGIGALVMLLWVLGAIGMWLAARAERKRGAVPEPGDWVDALLADLGKCPWCHLRECMDPRLCTCDDPCEMPLCQGEEALP